MWLELKTYGVVILMNCRRIHKVSLKGFYFACCVAFFFFHVQYTVPHEWGPSDFLSGEVGQMIPFWPALTENLWTCVTFPSAACTVVKVPHLKHHVVTSNSTVHATVPHCILPWLIIVSQEIAVWLLVVFMCSYPASSEVGFSFKHIIESRLPSTMYVWGAERQTQFKGHDKICLTDHTYIQSPN